ncbi:MAG: YegS/Rv2252/BmrU family lipid kinase [Clostridia bacterium]|nr:YegS/Rv2252/BmrU family lipid kinase [Clostridia bacterium]
MKKKALFLFNPQAGKSQVKNNLMGIIDLFVKQGYDVNVHPTQAPGEVTNLLSESASEYDLLLLAGGDGTLNEAVNGLMNCEVRPVIGYIPAGTVNDVASSLHIPKNIRKAAAKVAYGHPYSYDVGAFNQRHFIYTAAFGAFTAASYATPRNSKKTLGRTAYLLEGIRSLSSIKGYRVRIEYDGGCLEDDFLLGMVTNSTSVGGFKLFDRERISLNDGLLEASLIKMPRTPLEFQHLLNALSSRKADDQTVTVLKSAAFKITTTEELAWTLDGEYGGTTTLANIHVCPGAVSILI